MPYSYLGKEIFINIFVHKSPTPTLEKKIKVLPSMFKWSKEVVFGASDNFIVLLQWEGGGGVTKNVQYKSLSSRI